MNVDKRDYYYAQVLYNIRSHEVQTKYNRNISVIFFKYINSAALLFHFHYYYFFALEKIKKEKYKKYFKRFQRH